MYYNHMFLLYHPGNYNHKEGGLQGQHLVDQETRVLRDLLLPYLLYVRIGVSYFELTVSYYEQ